MSIDLDTVQWYAKSRTATLESRDPELTINPSGRLSLNRAAVSLFDEKPEAMQFGYVPTNSVIVLQAAGKKDTDAYAVANTGRRYQINTEKFMKQVGYHTEGKSVRFAPTFDKERNLLYFSLNESLPEPRLEDDKPKRRGRPQKSASN